MAVHILVCCRFSLQAHTLTGQLYSPRIPPISEKPISYQMPRLPAEVFDTVLCVLVLMKTITSYRFTGAGFVKLVIRRVSY